MHAGKHYYPELLPDNDPIPYYPHVVFSSNMPVPDLPGLVRGRGSWQGVEEASYALPSEEAWRIWPYTGDQEALLLLGRRNHSEAWRVAKLLARGKETQTLGIWDASEDTTGDYSEFAGVRYTIKPM